MNANLVCKELGIDRAKLNEWIKEGLPWSGKSRSKQFDEQEVVEWLIANDKVEHKDCVVATQAEAARALGIAESQLSLLKKRPGFPGRMGYFPVERIAEWLDENKRKPGRPKKESDSTEPDSISYQDQLRKLRLEKEQERLIHVDEVEREIGRAHAYAVAELHNLAAKIESRLPAKLERELVAVIRETVIKSVDEACQIIRDSIEGEDTEDE